MPDITVFMARPSTRCVFRDLKVDEVINKAFNNNIIGQCTSADDSDFGDDYTQLVTPGTQTFHDSVNESKRTKSYDIS
jgi:hypothetical protein